MSETVNEANGAVEGAVVEQEQLEPERGSRLALIAAWAWGVVITLLYAMLVVNAVGNLTGMRQIAAALDTTLSPTGWFWLLLGVALPVVVLAFALLLGRGRVAGVRVFLLVTGLAVVAALQLEIVHLVPQWTFFAM